MKFKVTQDGSMLGEMRKVNIIYGPTTSKLLPDDSQQLNMAINDLQILKTPIMSKKIPTLEIPNVGTPTLPNTRVAGSKH